MQDKLSFRQKCLDGKQKTWQVGITEQAKSALVALSRQNRKMGVPTSQGLIASTLILRAYENGESILG